MSQRSEIRKDLKDVVEKIRRYSKSQVKRWKLFRTYCLRAQGPVIPNDQSEYYLAHETGKWKIRPGVYVDLETGDLVSRYDNSASTDDILLVGNNIELINAQSALEKIKTRVKQIEKANQPVRKQTKDHPSGDTE